MPRGIVRKYISSDVDRALIAGLFFSLPFDSIPSFEFYSFAIRASSIIGLLIIARTIYLLISRKIVFANNFFYKLLFVFLLWVILLVPESIIISRGINYALLVSYVVILAVCISLIFKKEYIKPIVYAVIVSGGMAALFGVFQYFADYLGAPSRLIGLNGFYTKKTFGFTRPNSFLLEPLYFASYLALPFMICVSLFFSKEKIINQKILVTLILLFGTTILLTLSRGGILGVSLGTILIILIGLKYKVFDKRKILVFAILVIIGIAVSQIIVNNFRHQADSYTKGKQGSGAYVQQLHDLTLSNGDERKLSRDNALRVIKQDNRILVFGAGPAQYGPYVNDGKQVNGRWLNINNLPMAVLFELGIFGLILVISFFICVEYKSVATISHYELDIQKVFIIALVGYLLSQSISYQTYSTIYIMHVWACIGVMMGLVLNARKKTHNKL